MSREPSPIDDEIGLDLKADPEDDALDSDEEEPQGVEDGEFDDEEEEDFETQDAGELDETMHSDGERDTGRLLDRGEQLRMDGGDDALLDETQPPEETQEQDSQMQDDSENVAGKEPVQEKRGRGRPAGKSTNKNRGENASKKAPVPVSEDNPLGRQPGKSLLPMARVTKIIKADKDIPIIAKDAVFIISAATEEFIRRLVVAAHTIATRENRATVKQSDLASASRRIDEFLFLEDILPYMPSEGKAKPKGTTRTKVDEIKSGPMEMFMGAPKQAQANVDEDVVMQDETQDS